MQVPSILSIRIQKCHNFLHYIAKANNSRRFCLGDETLYLYPYRSLSAYICLYLSLPPSDISLILTSILSVRVKISHDFLRNNANANKTRGKNCFHKVLSLKQDPDRLQPRMTFNPPSSSSSSSPEPGPEPGHAGPAAGGPPGPQPEADPGSHPARLPDPEPLPPGPRPLRGGGANGERGGAGGGPPGGGEEGGAGGARHQHEPQQQQQQQQRGGRASAHRPGYVTTATGRHTHTEQLTCQRKHTVTSTNANMQSLRHANMLRVQHTHANTRQQWRHKC